MKIFRPAVVAAMCVSATLLGSSAAGAAAPAAELVGSTVAVPDGVTAAFVVYDRHNDTFTATRDPHAPFRSASVVKLLIALDELVQHDPELDLDEATTDEQHMEILALQAMLRGSWDHAASALWVKNGFTDVIDRMTALIGLTGTVPPVERGIWGYTVTTAADVVAIYDFLLDEAPAGYRDFIVGNLYAADRCAVDGRDQYFGIPAAFARPWGVKQGWSGWGSEVPEEQRCAEQRFRMAEFAGNPPAGREAAHPPADLVSPLLHTTGLLGPEQRSIVVVFTTFAEGTSWPQGAATITELSERLRPFVPGARADLGT